MFGVAPNGCGSGSDGGTDGCGSDGGVRWLRERRGSPMVAGATGGSAGCGSDGGIRSGPRWLRERRADKSQYAGDQAPEDQ